MSEPETETTNGSRRALGSWHLVTVEPKCEAKAIEKLKNYGFEGFCPMWTKRYRRTRAGKTKLVELDLPLFPGYIFVARPLVLKRFEHVIKKTRYDEHARPLDFTQWLANIEETEHVVSIVRFGNLEPAVFPDQIVADLRHAMALGCYVEDVRTGKVKIIAKGTTAEERERARAEAEDIYREIKEKYTPGLDVMVIGGPFADLVGRIKAAPVKDRVKVIFGFLGGETQVDMQTGQLEPLTPG